jgi:hypothetical protein
MSQMKAKLAIGALLSMGVVALGCAYLLGYPPFTSPFVQTCGKAIRERLAVPSTYQAMTVDESRRTITYDEFFTDPRRAVPEASRKAMVRVARVPPVQYVARIDYQAQDSIGAIIRESATCTFSSLEGDDTVNDSDWVMIDGEHNIEWAARQPNAAALLRRQLPR